MSKLKKQPFKVACKKNLTMITIVSLIDTAPMIYTIHSGTMDFNLYHQYTTYYDNVNNELKR